MEQTPEALEPEARTTFSLELTREELKQLRQEAPGGALEILQVESKPFEPGSPLREARFVETLVVTVAATVAWLVARLVDDWLKRREGGLLIDLSQKTPVITRDRNLPADMVLQKDPKGKVSIAWKKEQPREALSEWLKVTLK